MLTVNLAQFAFAAPRSAQSPTAAFTRGTRWVFGRDNSIGSVDFFWNPTTGGDIVKVCVWDDLTETLITSALSVPISTVGVYSVVFPAPVSLKALQSFTVSTFVTNVATGNASVYRAQANALIPPPFPCIPIPPAAPPAESVNAFLAPFGDGLYLSWPGTTGAGDSWPGTLVDNALPTAAAATGVQPVPFGG